MASWPADKGTAVLIQVITDDIGRLAGAGAEAQPLRSREEVAKQLEREREKESFKGLANKLLLTEIKLGRAPTRDYHNIGLFKPS